MQLKFTKLQALGNDFVLTEDPNVIDYIRLIADRKYGVGCDQVILLEGQSVRFWNPDGSEAQFCGNGCRAVFRYQNINGEIHTPAGTVQGVLVDDLVQITYPKGSIINTGNPYLVDVGNRHLIYFGDEPNWSSEIEFDNTINCMYLYNRPEWKMLIREAGAGETKSCGSGAMAASLAIWDLYGYKGQLKIDMSGGSLYMDRVTNSEGHDILFQSGPADLVFTGYFNLVSVA
jgi:diaminopimelate epimerase